jgi:hypothetical protein
MAKHLPFILFMVVGCNSNNSPQSPKDAAQQMRAVEDASTSSRVTILSDAGLGAPMYDHRREQAAKELREASTGDLHPPLDPKAFERDNVAESALKAAEKRAEELSVLLRQAPASKRALAEAALKKARKDVQRRCDELQAVKPWRLPGHTCDAATAAPTDGN